MAKPLSFRISLPKQVLSPFPLKFCFLLGHKIIRINNHEHTDLQEYFGNYVADANGQLVFVEGALVQAVRKGYWVILDELNLAPTEVLEALNRLMDDNRELFVPDLQQTIHPHPQFMLFATQNPARHYSGRKHLSKAFRNRFLELNVEDIPDQELAEILEGRCSIPRSFASKMVTVMRELQRRRQTSNAFAGKLGFITPRDLFRWAERPTDGYQQLAENGYFILAERLRSPIEKEIVKEVLSSILNVPLDVGNLFSKPEDRQGPLEWIPSTVRTFRLVEKCLEASEPVLLIGETSTGKTSICQLLANIRGQNLHILNCNLHTETSDFIGGFRPVRNRSKSIEQFRKLLFKFQTHSIWKRYNIFMEISVSDQTHDFQSSLQKVNETMSTLKTVFASEAETKHLSKKEKRQFDKDASIIAMLEEGLNQLKALAAESRMPFLWEDGVLVKAMKQGDILLVDELNLAEDAVLERMNSVLDVGRSVTLAEKGKEPPETVIAHPNFRMVATMNPGGDYGKKELSPALANRFTQIWVPPINELSEWACIVDAKMDSKNGKHEWNRTLIDFAERFRKCTTGLPMSITVRDLLAVIQFVNQTKEAFGGWTALVHGISMVFLDGLELHLGTQGTETLSKIRALALDHLQKLIPKGFHSAIEQAFGNLEKAEWHQNAEGFFVGLFGIPMGDLEPKIHSKYDLMAPIPKRNAFRLLRAMQLNKAILLEGSPGVGKTSLIASLAAMTGHKLIRVNLSEQTDMMDLLGADLPSSDGNAGSFRWCDGPLLSAIKSGHWILLDELNLATQQVLEGLNALTDHRSEIYIPELDETFHCSPSFRFFASQNPSAEGGGRKGLPKSFLNRFTRVFTEALMERDLKHIALSISGNVLPDPLLVKMVEFVDKIGRLCQSGRLGRSGGPWEFNLRDFLRFIKIDALLTNVLCTDGVNFWKNERPKTIPSLYVTSRKRQKF